MLQEAMDYAFSARMLGSLGAWILILAAVNLVWLALCLAPKGAADGKMVSRKAGIIPFTILIIIAAIFIFSHLSVQFAVTWQ